MTDHTKQDTTAMDRIEVAKAIYHATPRNKPFELLSAFKRERILAEADAFLASLSAAGYRVIGPDEVDPVTLVRPLDDWHEDYGDVVWWTRLEGEWLGEAAWIGTPNDSDWPGYHTHWSPHPPFPNALGRKA